MNKLKILIMVALLPLLAACGGGTSSLMQQDPPNNPTQPVVDPIIGTYLEGVDLTGGVIDDDNPIQDFIDAKTTLYSLTSGNVNYSYCIRYESNGVYNYDCIGEDNFIEVTSATGVASFTPTQANKDAIVAFMYNIINVTGLRDAHAEGWTGKGANIVVVDLFDDTGSITHGDRVMGIVYMVAPGANYSEWHSSDWSDAWVYDVFEDADIDVLNASYGVRTTYLLSDGITRVAYSYSDFENNGNQLNDEHNVLLALADNMVIVYSAGNNGDLSNETTTEWSCSSAGNRNTASSCTKAKFITDTDRTIFVGAYDNTTNDLTDYSVSAGDTMNDFIVADGNAFDDSQGTSFAAPRVAGAVALVAQKFPNTTAAERKTIILHTADDLGEDGVDAVYGHGRLNVGKALSPVGELH